MSDTAGRSGPAQEPNPRATRPGVQPYAANIRPAAHVVSPVYAVLGLLLLVAALVLALQAGAPPRPLDAGAPPDRFSAGRALPLLERLLLEGEPRPLGSPANAAMRERILAELSGLGLSPVTQTDLACVPDFAVCGEVVNVLARIPGRTEGPAVLLTAHYDSVGAGPGVADDLVGVAVVLETVRLLLAEGPARNPYIVVLTDGEEQGLLGAEAFSRHPWFADVGAVLNLEARGTRGQSLMFETNVDNAWIVDAFAQAAPRPAISSLFYELYRVLPNDTDFTVYKRAGLNGMNFAFAEEVAHYHTPLDDLEHLDLGSLQHHGDNFLAAARALGAADLADQPAGNSVFMDLVPGSVLRVPERLALPAAVVCLLAWLLMAATLVRRRVTTGAAAVSGLLVALIAVVAAAAAGYGAAYAVQALSGTAEPWYASPVPARVAVWLAALVGSLLSAGPAARRVGFWGVAAGAWLLWAVAAVATAATFPGASVVFLVPLGVATAAHALAQLGPRTALAPLAALVAAFAAAYVWLPLAIMVEALLGLALSAAVATCLGLALVAVLPLFGQGERARGARRLSVRDAVLVAGIAGVVVAAALAVRAPTFSELRPQRLNVWHVLEAQDGLPVGASWMLGLEPAGPVPAGFSRFGDFADRAATTLPLSVPGARYAEAPLHEVTPPTVEVLGDVAIGPMQRLSLRLVSGSEGSDWLMLLVPVPDGGADLAVVGTEHAFPLTPAPFADDGYAVFSCHGAACDGLELALDLGGPLPGDVLVFELTYGLPEGGAELQAARPATAVPSHEGDIGVVFNRMTAVTTPAP